MQSGELVQERYALEELLGHGGMGEVWRAHDTRLMRSVAIKFLAPQSTEDPEFLVRLFSEAQSVAGISHPHVVCVLDFGTSETSPYLVMEYVSGGTLGDLTDEPFMPERAVEIMQQVASGAGAAHQRGIVHRDIKPGNILLGADGTVKLADFGIAASDGGASLTATGAAIGSPHYISPEQATGARATPRSDVYAMGVVLYQLLTGRLPFDGGNPTAVAIAHVEKVAERPIMLVPDLDPDLDALVMRCLDKRPEARFADGTELAAALAQDQMTTFEPSPAHVAEQPGALKRRVLVGAGMALALLVLAGFAITHVGARPAVGQPPGAHHTHLRRQRPASTRRRPTRNASSSPTPSAVVVVPTPVGSPTNRINVKASAKPRAKASSPTAKPTSTIQTAVTSSSTPTPTPTASPTPTPTAPASPSPTG